jgi:hypothetical protein
VTFLVLAVFIGVSKNNGVIRTINVLSAGPSEIAFVPIGGIYATNRNNGRSATDR